MTRVTPCSLNSLGSHSDMYLNIRNGIETQTTALPSGICELWRAIPKNGLSAYLKVYLPRRATAEIRQPPGTTHRVVALRLKLVRLARRELFT